LQSKFDARKLREPLFEKGLNAFLENRPVEALSHQVDRFIVGKYLVHEPDSTRLGRVDLAGR
jgi:hypothetical protein